MNYSVQEKYEYLLGFPATPANTILVCITIGMSVSFLSNHIIQPNNSLGQFFKYLMEYGRFKTIHNRGFDLPKRYFAHYYIFGSLWNTMCFLNLFGVCLGYFQRNWIAEVFSLKHTISPQGDQFTILLAMFLVTFHTIKRLFECWFITEYSTTARFSVLHYVWGLAFYTILPSIIISECSPIDRLPLGTLRIKHLLGIAGFLLGSYLQFSSQKKLTDLRRNGLVSKNSYGIPKGGFFNLVTCPHYLGEILLYMSIFVIVTHQCHSWLLVTTYIFVVHGTLGVAAHSWYRKKFPNYPKQRKVLVPFLF